MPEALDPEAKENFWTQYWLKEALKENPDQLAKGHLSAYLEETCYWTAITTAQKLTNSGFTWMDCFQIARAAAAEPMKFFAKYDSNRSRFHTYSQLKLKTAILETIRAGREKEKYSQAGLLRSLTKTLLKKSLEKAGIRESQLPQYLLAWRCFKEIYIPTKAAGSQKLLWPDAKQLEAIANRYNQLRLHYSLSEPIGTSQLETLLLTCDKAVRDSTAPSVSSLDESDMQLAAPEEDFWGTESPDREWQEISSILSQTFAALSSNEQKMLQLEPGLGIKQADIGKAFNLKQFQVSRQLDRTKRVFVKAVAQWSKEQLNINLIPQQIEAIANQIDEWLEWYCKSLLSEIFQTTLFQNFYPEVELLRLYYGQNNSKEAVANQIGISPLLVNEKVMRVKQNLSDKLQSEVQVNLPVELNSLKSAEQRIPSLVEAWLKNAHYAAFEIERR